MAYISKITPLGSSESYDIRAAALGSASVGTSNRPIYLSSGVPTQCATPTSGNYFSGVPYVANDGVMEVGKYIDFHNSNTGTTDYDVRLTATTQLISSATIEANGLLKTTNNSNTVTIGSQNADWCHIYNSTNIPFIFNNAVATTSGNLGTASYPWNNLYMGPSNGAGIYYKGTKNTYRMIRFIDNTSDTYGNGISIGGGGQTIIGGGESADTAAAQAGTAGGEIMQVCNDGDVQIISNLQNGWDNRKISTFNTTGNLTLPAKLICANVGNTTGGGYTESGLEIREYNYGSAQSDTWGNAPRMTFHWGGRVEAQIGLASNSWLYTTAGYGGDLTTNGHRFVIEQGGTWNISVSGNAAYLTTPNTAGFKTDQYGNFQHQSTTTTDYWTIKSNAGTEKFKVNFENGDTNVNGTIYITPTLGTWREGIRIKPYSSWATIILGGNDLTADSGTSANSWSIHNNNGNFYITRNGSSTGTAQLACVSNKWSVSGNITSPSTASTWVAGQNSTNAAYNVGNATDTGSYWPWLRQTNTASSKWFSFGTLGTRFYWIGSATSRTENGYDAGMSFDVANGYLQGCSRVYGAVWNDYAEYRIIKDIIEPGRCVIETGKDDLILSTERLQPGAEIVSDTFGFAIGETDKAKTPIATTGRVLAYIYEGREAARAAIGKPVCSGPDGTVSIMTDEEYQKYGYCAIGTISAVPDYEEWGTGKVKINNRIWIRIR